MNDFTVHQFGTDTSGREILMTQYMHDWFEARVANLGFRPVIVQGAFMTKAGGGARASEGAHDGGGSLDLRTKDRTKEEIDAMVDEFRAHGAAAWRRDRTARHGDMDPHLHLTLGSDAELSPMATIIWNSYLGGGDGLKGPLDDYERRPDPLVKIPPPEALMVTKEDEAKIRKIVADELNKIFRDNDGGLPDIGRARIVSRDGKQTRTLGDLLYAAADKDKKS